MKLKVSDSAARKKTNFSVTTTSALFSAEFNRCRPNVSEIIEKHRDLLETGDTLKQLFLKSSERGRNLQELIT